MIEERDGENELLARYTYGSGIDEPLTMERGGQTYYYHRDGLGSITEISDSSGNLVERYEYDVYGIPQFFDSTGNPLMASAIGNPYLFTGRRYDPESGNYYYRTRMYSPTLGRFLQMDPLGYTDGLNLYVYVGNNPVTLRDPWGLWFGVDDVLTGPIDELLVLGLGYVYCRITGGCQMPSLRDLLPERPYNPPPFEPVPGPTPGTPPLIPPGGFIPVHTEIPPFTPCPTPDPAPLSNIPPVADQLRTPPPFPMTDPLPPFLMNSEAEKLFRGQYGAGGACMECAELGQGMWGGDIVNVMPPGTYQHFVLQLPDGRIYDPSYLGNFRTYNDQYIPQEILNIVGDNDTFSSELYEKLRQALEEVFPTYP